MNLEEALELFVRFFEALLFYYYLIPYKKDNCRMQYIISYFVYIVLVRLMIVLQWPESVQIVLGISYFIPVFYLFYNMNIKETLSAFIVCTFCRVFSEIIGILLVMTLTHSYTMTVLLEGRTLYLMSMMVAKIFNFLFIVFAKKKRDCNFEYANLPQVSLWLLPVFCNIILFGILVKISYKSGVSSANNNLQLVASFFILISSVVSSAIMEYIMNLKERELELTRVRHMQTLQQQYWHDKVRMEQKLQEIYHDMKNHLLVLEKNMQNQQENEEYLQKLQKEIDQYGTFQHTNNEYLDILLYEKIRAAKAKGVRFDCMFHADFKESIDKVDLCTIIGNALDNALEACCMVEHSAERFIELKVLEQENYRIIKVINSKTGKVKQKNKKLVTCKEDKERHGFGMASMEHAVKKYGGVMQWKDMGDVFILEIILDK